MEQKVVWIKRRWFDFRQGYSFYMVYWISGLNFLIIFYNFVIEKFPLLKVVFPDILFFSVIAIPLIGATGMLLGLFHRYYQLSTDQKLEMERNPIIQKMWDDIKEIKNNVEKIAEQK